MYLVSFDVGRFQRKKDGSKSRTRAHATETIRYDPFGARSVVCPLGSVTYDMLKVDFNSRRSVASFLYKWNNPGWFGEHELVEIFSKKNLSGLKSEQDKIELLIGEWLLIDGLLPITKSPTSAGANAKSDRTQGHADHDREWLSGRFRFCPIRPAVSTKITLRPICNMSRRTSYRQQAKLQGLEKDRKELSAVQDILLQRIEEMGSSPMAPKPSTEYRTLFRYYNKFGKALEMKDAEYMKEYGRGWDVAVAYEIPDIMSLCWLEVFACVQHGIPARQCSLCKSYFFVTGRANMRQCPECRKNPSKAWREAQKRAQEENFSL